MAAPLRLSSADGAAGGMTFGAALAALPLESLGWVGWTRNGAFVALALAVSVLAPGLLMRGVALGSPAIAFDLRNTRQETGKRRLAALLLALGMLAVGMAALELVFDPRYKDFPIYALTPVVVGLVALVLARRPAAEGAGLAEKAGFWILLLAGVYIPFNETLRNWQALWFSGLCLILAFTLSRVLGGRARG